MEFNKKGYQEKRKMDIRINGIEGNEYWGKWKLEELKCGKMDF